MFRAKLFYMDGEYALIDIEERNIEKFQYAIKEKEAYWNDEKTQGILISADQLRYVQFLKLEESNEPQNQPARDDNQKISSEDE